MRLAPLFAVVISQIAPNPALPEPAAEFVAVQNTGPSTVLLDGMRLTDRTGAVRGVVPPDTSLDPGQQIALQPVSGASIYGCPGNPYRALLTAWAPLNNDGDSVVLEAPDGTVVDRVEYGPDEYATDGSATPCAIAAPRPGTVRLAEPQYAAREGDRSVTLTLRRSNGTNGRVVVPYAVHDGSARGGSDFDRAVGTVALGAAQDSASFSVPLLPDSADEPDETFAVVLGAPGGGAALGEPARATIVVRDDDPPAPPLVTPVLAAPPVVPPQALAPAGQQESPAQVAPARASLVVAPWQAVLRRGGVAAAVTCDRDCEVRASGRIALGRGRFANLAGTVRTLRGHMPSVVVLRVRGRHVRAVRRALRKRGSLRATVAVTPAGGAEVQRGTRVR